MGSASVTPISPLSMSPIIVAAYSLSRLRSAAGSRAAQGVPKRGWANGRWVSPRARMCELFYISVSGSTVPTVSSAPHWVNERALQ